MAGRLKVALEARAAGCMRGDAAAGHRGDSLGAPHARQCVAPVLTLGVLCIFRWRV
ncbi:hypothetical protein CBM2634_A160058 [Cupriavidus taiwanensis]|uniref:Uncharacterized protein n=1 Tax=Cupriavidus taiwanensis TaxID=164546 RepID=A0A375IX95_9BURK|nr:hypothetical protein CBM2634_A160058 [Cupriavidus taiwanensis]